MKTRSKPPSEGVVALRPLREEAVQKANSILKKIQSVPRMPAVKDPTR